MAFSQNDYMITDLESLDSAGFTSEANSWVYKGASCPECIFTLPSDAICDSAQESQMVFGGPGAAPSGSSDYFEKTYASSSTAWGTYLLLGFEIWIFATSELTNAASVTTNQIFSSKIGTTGLSGGAPVLIGSCSTDFTSSQGSQIKYIYKYSYKTPVLLVAALNPMNFGIKKGTSASAIVDSMGVRNVGIYDANSIPNYGTINLPCNAGYRWTGTSCEGCYTACQSCSGPNQGECTVCKTTAYSYGNGICRTTACSGAFQLVTGTKNCIKKCSTGFYWARDGSCRESCEEPLVQSVDTNGAPICSSPCSDATQFVYPDGSCSSTCDPLLKEISEATLKLCMGPCQTSSEFVYPDGTCANTCPTPLSEKTEKNIKYCESPCPSTAKFLYPDQSCSATCDPPLIDDTENGIFSCSSPCEGSTKYLYPDGSCQDTCPNPFSQKTENNIKFCYSTCSGATKYVNPDKSCSASCDPLLIGNTENEIFLCSSPCSDSTKYLYPNGACLNTCPAPLSEKTEKGIKYCESPCPSNAKFLYEDQSCSPTCDPPLIDDTENGIFSCSSPCDPTEFLYLDGSCLNECPTLFSKKTVHGIHFCENPCSDATQFVYSDKSCSSQCPYPLSSKTERGAKYCLSPCDDYLYKDGSCLQNCDPPHIKSQSYNVNQCLSPCEDPTKGYFYEAELVCKSTCTFPYESKAVDGIKICSKTSQMTSNMTAQEVEETESLVSSIKSQGKVTGAGMKTASALNSGSPNFAWLAGQASMLFYIRYINLNYTPKLKLVFFLQDASPFDFTVGINMPEGLQEKLRDRELPEIFERFEIHSNFFYNSWDMLSSFLLILGILLALSVLKAFTAKYTKIDKVLAGVLGSLKWNTLLMVICGSYGEVFFNASIQLQAGSVDSAWEVFSIILAIFMIFVGIAILALNGKVVRDLWRSRNVKSDREEMEKKWANFELFFESCEESSLASFSCMGIFLGRTLVFNLIVATLYNYPLMQSILINLTTFGMAGYLISKRPLKGLLEFAQILVSEVFVVIVNICTLIIAIMDHAQIEGQSLRNDVCNTIITIFSIFTSFSLAFLAIQVLITLFLFVRILRRLKAQGQLNLRGISNTLLFGNEENPAVEEKNNGTNLPVQIHPQMNHNQSESLHVTEDFNNSNRIQTIHETNRIFIPHRPPGRRIINNSRKIRPSFSYLDRSAGEMLPSDGSFHNTVVSRDISPGLNQQVTLESDNRDSVFQTVDSEKRDLGSQDTISQYRKMKSYLRRNRERRQPE